MATKALSPVKVIRHFKEDFNTDLPTAPPSDRHPTSSLEWRRFSSNFTSIPSRGEEDTSGRLTHHGIERSSNGGTNPETQRGNGKWSSTYLRVGMWFDIAFEYTKGM